MSEQQYEVKMRLEFNTTVTVRAASPEEALEKAKAGTFEDDGLDCAEMCNWETRGIAKAT